MKLMTLFAASLFWVLGPSVAVAADSGSCVGCHEGLGSDKQVSHNFADWANSVHAAAGVSCEACHGGDASAKDMRAAHNGIKRSTDVTSRIYFTRVPETCGACHEAEFKAFQKSAHYRELQKTGKGPNCVTCHGAMANGVLSAKELETTCALCHRQPTNAFAARIELNSSAAMVRSLEMTLSRAKNAGAVDLAPQEKSYRGIVEMERAAMIQWHTFNMAEVVSAAREVKQRVTGVLAELKLKKNQPEKK